MAAQADFIVGAEVRPVGSGLKTLTADTKGLTAATRENTQETQKNTEQNRRARATEAELEAAERRRRATLEGLMQAVRANNLALAQASTDHARYRQQVEAATEAKRKAIGVVNSFRAAIVALQVAVAALGLGALVRDSVQVALAFDRANKSQVAAAGSQQAASREMAFVTAEADRLGLSLTTTAQTYASLSNAARGTILAGQGARNIFSAVSEAVTVLGLSAEQTQGALLGVQQTISKGRVTAEELVQQISERLPGAYQAMADSLGISTSELAKRLEHGKVGLKDLIGWAEELRKRFAAGLTTAVNSYQANINRLTNLTQGLKREVGEGFLSGFLTGFADLKKALSAEELKAAARDLGESIGKALRTATDAAMLLAKALELVKAGLIVVIGLKVAAWFMGLSQAVGAATGTLVTFRAVSSNLALAGGLAGVGIALLAVIVIMQKYIMTSRLAMEAELARVEKSQEIFGYYQTLKANKVGLTEAEAAYAVEVRKTMEAERAALAVSLERTKAQLQASMTLNPFKYAQVAGPGRNVLREQVKDQERELKTIDNQLHILEGQWDRLGKLPVIKLPVDPGQVDKAAKKLANLLEGFRRTAEQAERIQAAQERGGPSEAVRETAEIERENAAYQALHNMEGLSAASKLRLTAIIEGLVGRTQDANRATAESAAETARSLTFTAAAAEAEAKLQDAKAQSTLSSREAAMQTEADTIARERQKEGDADYVAGLLQVIRARRDYLDGIALEIAAVERQIAHAATLRQKRAELADAAAQDTLATRRLTVELEAETDARARGIQVGSIWYTLLLAAATARAQEVAVVDQQTAAQRRLNDALASQRQARAEFTDWNRQRDAVKAYGSEIAGILDSYGLLSEATQALAIHEQALAIAREEGHVRTVEQIEAELRGYAAVEQSLARQAAALELQAYVIQPGIDALRRVGQTLQSEVLDRLIEGNLDFEDLWKGMARTFLEALAEMLKRWILTHRMMQAEAMRTAAVNAASAYSGSAGVGGGWMGSAYQMGMAAKAYQGGAAGGASGAGMSAGTLAGYAVAAYALFVIYKAFIEDHKVKFAAATISDGEISGIVSHGKKYIAGVQSAATELLKVLADFAKETDLAVKHYGSVVLRNSKEGWAVSLPGQPGRLFASMAEAQSYAQVLMLKFGEFSDSVSAMVQSVIKRTRALSMEALAKDIAFIRELETQNLDSTTLSLKDALDRAQVQWDRVKELFGTGLYPRTDDLDSLGAALTSIVTKLASSLRDTYNQLAGIQLDPAQEWEAKKAAYNTQRVLVAAQIQLWILEIEKRIQFQQAGVAFVEGAGALGRGMVNVAGGVIGAAFAMVEAAETVNPALAALIAIKEQLQRALEGLPPELTGGMPNQGGRGGGGGRDRDRARQDLLDEVQGWKLGEIGTALRDASKWFADFKERLKDLGLSAAKQAELLGEAQKELERRQKEIKDQQIGKSQDFIAAGTAGGGPLVKALLDNKKTQEDLIKANRELYKGGELTKRELHALNNAIREAGERQRDQMIGTAADQLFLDLYGLLGDEAAAAQLRFDLTVAELELRREELRLAMETAGWTKERMDAILGPLGVLLDKVVAAGPGIFGPRSGSEGSGLTGGLNDLIEGSEEYWKKVKEAQQRAQELLAQYRDAGRNEYELAREKVERDFAEIRSALGDNAEIADLFTAAMGRLRTQFLEGVREFYEALKTGDISGLNTEQRYGAAQAEYSRLLAIVQGGDLSQANALAQAGQNLVQLAGQMWGTSTGGYAELREAILGQLRSLLGITAPPAGANPGGGPLPGAGVGGAPPPSAGGGGAAAPDSDRQVAATNRVSDTVDFSGRKQEKLLSRIGDILDELKSLTREIRDEAAKPAPTSYGNTA